jgi:hypothetical protein
MRNHNKKSKIKFIAVAAVNEDGRSILSNVDVENKTLEEAIKEIVSEISEKGYIMEAETGKV